MLGQTRLRRRLDIGDYLLHQQALGGRFAFSDSFNRANGALSGRWLGGAGWAISSNAVVNTPTPGAELLTDPGMEIDPVTNWPVQGTPTTYEQSAAQAHGGSNSLHVVADTAAEGGRQQITTSVGLWHQVYGWVKRVSGTFQLIRTSGFATNQTVGSGTDWVQVLATERATGANPFMYLRSTGAGASEFYADDASIKPLTLADLIKVVKSSTADVACQVEATITSYTQAGVCININSYTSPTNGVFAYHDGTNAKLDKLVAGTWTNLISAVVAYAPGGIVKIVKSGTTYQLFYQGVQVGGDQTINDASVISNTYHGMFSTYSGNSFDNFSVSE